MASQASSPSTMWKFWLPCPISMSCWLAHLLLARIVQFNHCFGNAAPNTSQCRPQWSRSPGPQSTFGWLLWSHKSHGDGWYLLRLVGMACAFKISSETSQTVLRRLRLLRLMTMSHSTEKPSYWRYYLSPRAFSRSQVFHLNRRKGLLSYRPLPNMWVTKFVEESLPHQQTAFWSESVLWCHQESVACGFSENIHLCSSHLRLFLRHSLFPFLPAVQARGDSRFISKIVSNPRIVGGADKRRLCYEEMGRDLFPSVNVLL